MWKDLCVRKQHAYINLLVAVRNLCFFIWSIIFLHAPPFSHSLTFLLHFSSFLFFVSFVTFTNDRWIANKLDFAWHESFRGSTLSICKVYTFSSPSLLVLLFYLFISFTFALSHTCEWNKLKFTLVVVPLNLHTTTRKMRLCACVRATAKPTIHSKSVRKQNPFFFCCFFCVKETKRFNGFEEVCTVYVQMDVCVQNESVRWKTFVDEKMHTSIVCVCLHADRLRNKHRAYIKRCKYTVAENLKSVNGWRYYELFAIYYARHFTQYNIYLFIYWFKCVVVPRKNMLLWWTFLVFCFFQDSEKFWDSCFVWIKNEWNCVIECGADSISGSSTFPPMCYIDQILFQVLFNISIKSR